MTEEQKESFKVWVNANIRSYQKRRNLLKEHLSEEEEKEFRQPLPETPYEPAIWLNPKVGTDYLVTDGINKYSVPYDLIGEIVDVRVSKNTVEVFYHTIVTDICFSIP